MSGRLVILPHKSWNVWNRDNREKVLKDEREHREKEEALRDKSTRLLQEQNLGILREEDDSLQAEKPVIPFRLFDDLEKKAITTNDEYMKEKETKEKRSKQRDGTAAWALGEGSTEVSKLKPWYENGNSTESKVALSERELRRIASADPLSHFISGSNNNKHITSSNKPINNSSINTMDLPTSSVKEKHKKKRHRDECDDESERKQALISERDAILAELQKRCLYNGAPSSNLETNSNLNSNSKQGGGRMNSRWNAPGSNEVSENRYSQQYNPTIAKHIRSNY